MIISAKSTIEEIVSVNTGFIDYLSKQGIRCIRCGEPIWGTLEEAATLKGFSQEQIQHFIDEMNIMFKNKQDSIN